VTRKRYPNTGLSTQLSDITEINTESTQSTRCYISNACHLCDILYTYAYTLHSSVITTTAAVEAAAAETTNDSDYNINNNNNNNN